MNNTEESDCPEDQYSDDPLTCQESTEEKEITNIFSTSFRNDDLISTNDEEEEVDEGKKTDLPDL